MAGKSIKELIIKVKQQNVIKVSKDVERVSEALLEATEYAEMFNEQLSNMKVPAGLDKFVKTFDKMEASLEEIATQTRRTTNSIGAMRNESIEIADNFQSSFQVISEGLDDLGSDAIRSTKKVEKGFDGVTTAVNGTTTALGKTTKANTRLGNGLKDTNRQGTNSVRQFSKMAQSAGGLASSYALVAANIFALSEGFRLMNEAAAVDRLEEVSTVISAGIGVSIAGTAQAMRDATDGAISYQAALRQAAAATAYGFDTEQIENFTQVARRAAVVLGVEMTDALNRVIRGISKAEVELLDELGVTVRLNEAFARYAAQHNIAASSLNSFQRQQALANEVILKSEQNLGAADSALESTSWEQFGANVSSATSQLLRFIATSDSMLSVLGGFNSAFEEIKQLARSDAEFTPYTKTLEESPDALSSIVAYNNLIKERNRLEKEGSVARSKAVDLTLQGIDGSTDPKVYLTYDKATMKLNDRYNTLQAQVTGVRHELDLTDEALQKFAGSMGISVDEVALVADSIQNLGLLSRSLGSDLTTFDNQVRGNSTNPYKAMSSSINEAIADIKLLEGSNLTLEDSLKKLKISEDQYNNFGDIQAYISLLDEQELKTLDISKHAATMNVAEEKALYLAKQDLAMIKEKNAKSLAALDTTKLTVAQRTEEFKAQQAVLDATRKLQERNRELVAQEQQLVALKTSDQIENTYASAVYLAEEELRILKEKQATFLEENKGRELSIKQEMAMYTATKKVADARKAEQANNLALLSTQREGLRAYKEAINPQLTSVGIAHNRLTLERETLDMMLKQNKAAEALGNKPKYSNSDLTAQQDKVAEGDTALDSDLSSTNFSMQQSALSTLSPELASSTSAIYALSDAWAVMGDSSSTAAQAAQASAAAMGSGLQAISGLVAAAAGAATSAIDLEIAAVQNSGLTAEEQEQKTKQLNKKKIKEEEKYAKASILISTAQGIMLAFATSGNIYAGIALAAVTAAAGAMAYQQASNSASAQLAGLSSATSATPATLTVGDFDGSKSTDVSTSATQSERAQTLGDRGVYGRAGGGKGYANKTYLAGENGKELITPMVDSNITPVSQLQGTGPSSGSNQYVFNIQALDAQSFADRMPELAPVMEEHYEQQGRHLASD